MKNKFKIYIFLCFCLISSARLAFPEEAIKIILNNVKSVSIEERYNAIFKLHKLGKFAIPSLIQNIEDCEEIDVILQNPISSNLHPDSLKKNCSGIIYAYTIELILGRNNLVKNTNNYKIAWTLGNNSQNYIYQSGIILTNDGSSVSQKDLIEIKKIYINWWEKNKNKSIEQLQKEWKDNIKPLSGTNYHWK